MILAADLVLDISRNNGREVACNFSTRFVDNAYLIYGDLYVNWQSC